MKNEDIIKKNVLILGAGGVAPSIIYALKKKQIEKLFISNRTPQKAKNIKRQKNK